MCAAFAVAALGDNQARQLQMQRTCGQIGDTLKSTLSRSKRGLQYILIDTTPLCRPTYVTYIGLFDDIHT